VNADGCPGDGESSASECFHRRATRGIARESPRQAIECFTIHQVILFSACRDDLVDARWAVILPRLLSNLVG